MLINGREYEIESCANLRRADLRRADLRGARLNGADLNGADLNGADLRRADLNGADLNGANLNWADLNGANLRRANLSGANLSGARGIVCAGSRADGHLFAAGVRDGVLWVYAGCRAFPIAEARKHWQATRANTPLGDETFAMLDFIERMAAIRNLLKGE